MRFFFYIGLVLAASVLVSCGQNAPLDGTDVSAEAEAPQTASVLRDANGRPLEYMLLGQKLPSFSLETTDAQTFTFDTPDTWTVLAFWGIWCGDCRVDGPYKNALSVAIAQDPELSFMSIHTPPNARRADEAFGAYPSIDAYMDEHNYTFPVAIDFDAAIRDLVEVRWTPTYLVVDPQGVVRGFRTDFSVSQGEPVKEFIQYIGALKSEDLTPQQ